MHTYTPLHFKASFILKTLNGIYLVAHLSQVNYKLGK